MEPFKPLAVLEEGLRFWWAAVLLVIFGGVCGGILFAVQPAVYEARASISIGIDFTRTGVLDIAQEDKTIEVMQDELQSARVFSAASQNALAKGKQISAEKIRQAGTLERRDHNCILIVRSEDPQFAFDAANLWAEAALESVSEARGHALKAEALNRYLDSLTSCLGKTAVIEPSSGYCNLRNLADIQFELENSGKVMQIEKNAARGILPAAVFSLPQPASFPSQPIRGGRNFFVAAGGIIGLLFSVCVFQFGLMSRLFSDQPHR